MFDSRLETNIYKIHLQHQLHVGVWIGANVNLKDQRVDVERASAGILAPKGNPAFERVDSDEPGQFLDLREGEFVEYDSGGNEVGTAKLEYVTPRPFSDNTTAVLPVAKVDGEVLVGVESRDLPAPQIRMGSAEHITIPCFRLDRSTSDLKQAQGEARARLLIEFGLEVRGTEPLGGKFFPSPGVVPELVYPIIAEVDLESSSPQDHQSGLKWIPMKELLENHSMVRDGHLLTALFRGAHALGLMKD